MSPTNDDMNLRSSLARRQALSDSLSALQIDVGLGDAITPAATDMDFPTLLDDKTSPNVLAYPNETIVAEKAEAIVDLGLSNSRMKDFTDIAMAARRWTFDADTLVAALGATFRRRRTPLPDDEIVALSERFVQDERARANWKAFVTRNHPDGFDSLTDLVNEVRSFLLAPLEHVRTGRAFNATWNPGGPWA